MHAREDHHGHAPPPPLPPPPLPPPPTSVAVYQKHPCRLVLDAPIGPVTALLHCLVPTCTLPAASQAPPGTLVSQSSSLRFSSLRFSSLRFSSLRFSSLRFYAADVDAAARPAARPAAVQLCCAMGQRQLQRLLLFARVVRPAFFLLPVLPILFGSKWLPASADCRPRLLHCTLGHSNVSPHPPLGLSRQCNTCGGVGQRRRRSSVRFLQQPHVAPRKSVRAEQPHRAL